MAAGGCARRVIARLRSSDYVLAGSLGVFFLSLYLLTGSSDLLHNGDTDLRYQTTQAIVDQGRLWIAHPYYHDSRVALGLGHHLYAFYGPGQTILMIPLYVAGKVIAHHLGLPYDITTLYAARSLDLFLGAALAVLFYWFAQVAGYTRQVSAVLTMVFGAATVAWPDAQSALEQTQVNLFLLFAVISISKFQQTDSARRWLIAAGSGVGLAILTRYDAALYVPLLVVYILFLRWRRQELQYAARDLVVLIGSTLPFIVAIGAWNVARFGSPFTTGLHEQTLGNPFISGVVELLVSPGKGVLWYLPLVFLLPWAIPRFFRRQADLAILCTLLTLLPLAFYANVQYWHGDPSWGPRYLYVAVPYLILPLGEILRNWSGRARPIRLFAVVLVLISLALEVSAVSVTQWRFWYRLEALQQQSANANAWTGQPFRWGAQHYHYYWNIKESPIVLQVDDLYQVARLTLGQERFRLTAKPDPFVSSNTALLYPVNSLGFWWTDTLHPLLGQRARDALAALLSLLVLASFGAILVCVWPPRGWIGAPAAAQSQLLAADTAT